MSTHSRLVEHTARARTNSALMLYHQDRVSGLSNNLPRKSIATWSLVQDIQQRTGKVACKIFFCGYRRGERVTSGGPSTPSVDGQSNVKLCLREDDVDELDKWESNRQLSGSDCRILMKRCMDWIPKAVESAVTQK